MKIHWHSTFFIRIWLDILFVIHNKENRGKFVTTLHTDTILLQFFVLEYTFYCMPVSRSKKESSVLLPPLETSFSTYGRQRFVTCILNLTVCKELLKQLSLAIFFSSCNLIASQQKSFLYIKTLITINHILVLLYKIQLSHLMILMNLKYFFSECDCNQEIVIRSGKTLCVLVGSSLQVLHYNVHINRT